MSKRAAYKQQVDDLIESWKDVLGIAAWSITVKWKRKLQEHRAAQVKVTAKYRLAEMEFSEKELRKATLDSLEEVVVHELAHILTEPLAGEDEERLEGVTTDVEKAILRARNSGMAICD